MMFRVVFWVVLPCKMIVDNLFTRQYNPEDSSERDNRSLKNMELDKVITLYNVK
jgi:hypothetical protein